MLPLLIALFVLAGLIALVWSSDVRSTVAFVLDRGGVWIKYNTCIGCIRIAEFQFRFMTDRSPRAWKRSIWTGRLKPVDYHLSIATIFEKKWRPIQIPLRGFFDIGVNLMIERLDVCAKLGVEGDAAATALLCGAAVTALQALKAVSTRGRSVPGGVILVRPVFNRARLSVRFKCILAIKASHIIREVIEGLAGRKRDGQSSD